MCTLSKAVIHITGVVQGVGFRPFVYELAKRYELTGWVRNSSSGVDIEVDGEKQILLTFIATIKIELPPLARIDSFEVSFMSPGRFSNFEIYHSESTTEEYQPISPDVCICSDCLEELFNSSNRRYHYPFINCTNCGPRFTIIRDIPYDRPNTTMAHFQMCENCLNEYLNPQDRRFHAQPIACPACGPKVWFQYSDNAQRKFEGDDAINEALKLIAEGNILAIKGLGGFHLACDSTSTDAVSELRRRKLRVDKPFAIMMSNVNTVKNYCYVDRCESSFLQSRQRPIVILKRKEITQISELVAPNQNTIGVMLPYTPLHYLLLPPGDPKSRPLIMTSGNLSEEPIAFNNEEALETLSPLADGFLLHDRDIHTRCDDSVGGKIYPREHKTQSSPALDNFYFIRRARGYAPDPIIVPNKLPMALAVGPELKNTFCLSRDNYAFMSHHIGDMENIKTIESFEQGIDEFERLFRIKPEAIFYDLHPNYFSTQYAFNRLKKENLPGIPIQHHHAHIASCMADNQMTGDEMVIGLAFDGTGYGIDGAIWGGEFLLGNYDNFQRLFHIAYFKLPGGDTAIKNPYRSALALLWSLGIPWEKKIPSVQGIGDEELQNLQIQLEHSINTNQTSSMGRLFDAVSSLTGIKQRINYEAQAAIEFESIMDEEEKSAYQFILEDDEISLKIMITALLEDVLSGVPCQIISARFHNGLVSVIREICDIVRHKTHIMKVVLSGGVWHNQVLITRVIRNLQKDGFYVYWHNQIPTNDGGVSLGQMVIGVKKLFP